MDERDDALRGLCRQQGAAAVAHLWHRLPDQPPRLHGRVLAVVRAIYLHLLPVLQVCETVCARHTVCAGGSSDFGFLFLERTNPHRSACRGLLLCVDVAVVLPFPAL